MASHIERRKFLATLGGAAAAWPLAARAQQPAMPVIGFLHPSSPETYRLRALRQGLKDAGFVEGENVAIEYRWADGHYDRMPALASELVGRRVAVIATTSSGAFAAKAATTTIPIVFIASDDPVKLGLVSSLARPGGNATGINFFAQETTAKRLALLHELVPKATRIAVLINPANASTTEATLKQVREAAGALGLQVHAFNASTGGEIEVAFAALARERADALFVAGDGFFFSRRVQLATLAARDRVPACYVSRAYVEAGGLMNYGTNITDMFRQAGIYTGSILGGAKPSDLPVLQSTKFEFLINLQTARALGLAVPPMLLARADEVIE